MRVLTATLALLAGPALAGTPLDAAFEAPVPAIEVAEGDTTLLVALKLPEGRKLSTEAEHHWQAVGVDGVGVRVDGEQRLTGTRIRVPLEVAAEGSISLSYTVFHCTPSDCKRTDATVDVPIKMGIGGKRAEITIDVE